MKGFFHSLLAALILFFAMSCMAAPKAQRKGSEQPAEKPTVNGRFECDIKVVRVFPRKDGGPVTLPINPCGFNI